MMKFCSFLFLPLIAGVHAIHDVYDTYGELNIRDFNGLAPFKARDLEFTYLQLRPRSIPKFSSQLVKRGPCMSKGCLGTRPSGGQQRQGQSQQGQRQQGRSQEGQRQQNQPQQGQHQPTRPSGQPPTGRLSGQLSDSSIGAPSIRSSSATSLRGGSVAGDQIRWGSLIRDSPSWDARQPPRASSHAAQQFTNALRNQHSAGSSSAPNSGAISAASETRGQSIAMSSFLAGMSNPDQGLNSGAMSLDGRGSGTSVRSQPQSPTSPRTPRQR